MKTIITASIASIAFSWSAFGAAEFFTRSQLIERATVIAIVSLEEPEEAKPAGKNTDPFADVAAGEKWIYSRQATMRIEKVLKGEIPEEVIIYGDESFICAQCKLSKGRFLAFLRQDGELWSGVNWHLSLRPIRNKKVEWYVSEELRYPMEFTAIP